MFSDTVNVGNISGKIKLGEIVNKMWTQDTIHSVTFLSEDTVTDSLLVCLVC